MTNIKNTKSEDELIEKAQSKEVLSFGLPSGRAAIVKANGDLVITTGDKEVCVGYFEKNDETIKWTGYHFMYEPGEKRIMNCNEREAKDLVAFAVKLGRFFDSRMGDSMNDLEVQLVEAGLRNLYVSR